MFFLDVENEGVLRVKAAQRAVAFVSFGNEVFAARVPMRVCSENWNFSADIVRRMQAAFAKHVCSHCGRSCFAMHSGDHDAALGLHDCSDGFRPAGQRFSGTPRSQENWIVVFDRGGKNDKLSGIRMLGSMLILKAQAEPLQSIRLGRRGLVGPADGVSQRNEKPCETAHTASRHADQVNLMLFTGQKSRQVRYRLAAWKFFATRIAACGSCFRREIHEWVYFSIVFATRPAASLGARRAQFADICCSSCRFSITWRILRASNSPEISDCFRRMAASA